MRRWADLPLPDPHIVFLQLDLSSRCNSSGGWATAISDAPVRDTHACMSDHVNSAFTIAESITYSWQGSSNDARAVL